jgi:hypothetical protein
MRESRPLLRAAKAEVRSRQDRDMSTPSDLSGQVSPAPAALVENLLSPEDGAQ